jgi:hypothetical protein
LANRTVEDAHTLLQQRCELVKRRLFNQRDEQVHSLASIGVVFGLVIGPAAARSLEHFTFGVSPSDRATIIEASLLLLGIAGLAALIPPAGRTNRSCPRAAG